MTWRARRPATDPKPALRRRAQTIVEVAVAFPLLVLAALALVTFARYYQAHTVVEAAVQDGARAAAAIGATPADGQRRAEAILHAGLGRGAQVQLDWSGSNSDSVEARATGHLTTFWPWFEFSRGPTHLNLPLNSTAVVSRERFRR